MRVLVVDPIDPTGMELPRGSADVPSCGEASLDGIRRDAREADAIITRRRLPDDIFDAAPRLRVASIHGTGTDLVPRASANAHGVAIAHLPGGNAQSVAEYCLAAMLVLARNLVEIVDALKSSPWDAARALGAAAARETLRMLAGQFRESRGLGQVRGETE